MVKQPIFTPTTRARSEPQRNEIASNSILTESECIFSSSTMIEYTTNDVYLVCTWKDCEYTQEFPEEVHKHWTQHHGRETAKDWVTAIFGRLKDASNDKLNAVPAHRGEACRCRLADPMSRSFHRSL